MHRGGYNGRGRGGGQRGRPPGRTSVASRLGLHPSKTVADARDRLVMNKRTVHDARAFIRKSQFDKAGDLRAVLKTQESGEADADIARELKRVNAERGNIRDASDKMLLSQGSRNRHPTSKRGMMKGKTLVISRQFKDAPLSSPPLEGSPPQGRSRSRSPLYVRRSLSRSPRPPPHERRHSPPDVRPYYREEQNRDAPRKDSLPYHQPTQRDLKSREPRLSFSGRHPGYRVGHSGSGDRAGPRGEYRPDYCEPVYRSRSRSPRRDLHLPPGYYYNVQSDNQQRRYNNSRYDDLRYKEPRNHPHDISSTSRHEAPPRHYSSSPRLDVRPDELLRSRDARHEDLFQLRRADQFHSRFSHSLSPIHNQHQIKSQVHVSPGYSRRSSGNDRIAIARRSVSPGSRRLIRTSPTHHRVGRRISLSPTPERNRVTSTVHRAGFPNEGDKYPIQQQTVSQVRSAALPPLFKIRVTNLDANVNQDDIYELFSDIGKVKSVNMVRAGMAEVLYYNYDDVKKAVEAYNRRELDRRPMSVDFIGHV